MKSYSSDSITRREVDSKVSSVDTKQTEQIRKLRLWLAGSAVVNLLVAIGAYFFKL